jgi:hypothetical protein
MRGWRRLAALGALAVGLALVGAFALGLVNAASDAAAMKVSAAGSAKIDPIVGPAGFGETGGDVAPDFDIGLGGAVALSVGDVLRTLDARAAAPELRPVKVLGAQPSSIALDVDGPMLGVAGGYFGLLQTDAAFAKAIPMTNPGMRLAPSPEKGVVFLFGGVSGDWRLYDATDQGDLHVLLQSDRPIVSAAEGPGGVYAATATTIMRLRAGTPQVLFTTPADFAGPIRSIAVGADDVLFFATDAKVYVLIGPNALSVVNDAGGSIRVKGERLYVLDPRRRLLFSLAPASAQLIAKDAP